VKGNAVDRPAALALAAHPDDIELMMAGTLALLGRKGYALHVMNVADGSCGSMTQDAAATAKRRLAEARASAAVLGAKLHPPIARDLEIFYNEALLRKVAAVVREVAPTIVLLQSPMDYMEDHMNASRLGVTGAFVRSFPNFVSDPPRPPGGPVALYHALPWGLEGPLREPITPDFYLDIASAFNTKREALACHSSQREWLDQTQGLNSYLLAMEDAARDVGRMSGRFELAEGWRRHSHLGFGAREFDPLRDALGDKLVHCREDSD
jgi:LmbE family N-acetylglucosaminyl deacetylase